MVKHDAAMALDSDKSATEPDQFSLSRINDPATGQKAEHLKGTPDASWYNYQEQKSNDHDNSPLLVKDTTGMIDQIASIENGIPRQSDAGETVLLDQIAALQGNSDNESNSNSDYDSFHSDEDLLKSPDDKAPDLPLP